MAERMLEINNAVKVFSPGTPNENRVLKGMSLTLHKGEYVTVIGGNGAGKSTLLNIIAGVFPIDEGKVIIDAEDVTRLPEYSRAQFLGRVFQDPMMGTASRMSIGENLALAARRGQKRTLRWGLPEFEQERFKEMLSTLGLGLEERLDVKVGKLSGGQRQAITLLMATLCSPKILLLDEHTAALDPKTAAKVLELTDMIVKENGLTTLMITHNMNEAIKHGNRLIMMDSGRVILDIKGEQKSKLTVDELLNMFASAGGEEMPSDRMILGSKG